MKHFHCERSSYLVFSFHIGNGSREKGVVFAIFSETTESFWTSYVVCIHLFFLLLHSCLPTCVHVNIYLLLLRVIPGYYVYAAAGLLRCRGIAKSSRLQRTSPLLCWWFVLLSPSPPLVCRWLLEVLHYAATIYSCFGGAVQDVNTTKRILACLHCHALLRQEGAARTEDEANARGRRTMDSCNDTVKQSTISMTLLRTYINSQSNVMSRKTIRLVSPTSCLSRQQRLVSPTSCLSRQHGSQAQLHASQDTKITKK